MQMGESCLLLLDSESLGIEFAFRHEIAGQLVVDFKILKPVIKCF